MSIQLLSSIALLTLMLTAVACDLRTRRVPNLLVGSGIALGLLFQTVALSGSGLFSTPGGALGIGPAQLGGLAGLALFLPMYALRTLGAGDVKLLAMAGVWLGPEGVVWAALWTLAAGGVLSLAVALWTGVLRQVLGNLHLMMTTLLIKAQTGQGVAADAAARTTGRLPYAVAIGCGTAFEVARLLSRAAT